jgi:uncharacterized protein
MSVLEPLLQKQEALAARLRELSSVLVAWAARQALGDAMLAVIADSPSLSRSHLRDALLFAEECGIPVRTVNTAELEHEAYAVNQADRCFHCKDELFTVLEAERARLGFAAVAYGLNTDDKRDFRPGQKAAAAHRVAAPLADAGLTKEDIRALAQAAGLRVWDKPASACLSSRIEYGRRVTPEVLRQVEDAEEALFALGLRRVRVRHHGTIARVEIAEEEMGSALRPEMFRRIGAAVKAAGFHYVAVDCDGYRSGSMNELLPVSALTAALTAGR